MSASFQNPLFKQFIQRDPSGQIIAEDLSGTTQNPDIASFLEDLVLNDSDRYLAMLLDRGARLPKDFDIDTIHHPSHNNATQHMTPQQDMSNTSNNNIGATTQGVSNTINGASSSTTSQNTSTSTTMTFVGGSFTQSTPTMTTTPSQMIGATFTQSIPTMSTSSSHMMGTTLASTSIGTTTSNPMFGTSSTTIGASSSHAYGGTSFNPFNRNTHHVFIQGQGTQMTQQMNTLGHQMNQGFNIPQIQTNTVGSHIPTYSS